MILTDAATLTSRTCWRSSTVIFRLMPSPALPSLTVQGCSVHCATAPGCRLPWSCPTSVALIWSAAAFQCLLLGKLTRTQGLADVHSSFVLQHVVSRTALLLVN